MANTAHRATLFVLCLGFACGAGGLAGDREVAVTTGDEAVVLAGTLSSPDGLGDDELAPAVVVGEGV